MSAITLIAITAKGFGRSYHFNEQAIIGRQADCDIQIIDSQASKQHARLFVDDRQWKIEDLHSLNGVFVNAEQIKQPRALKANDLISIGSQAFIFDPDFALLRCDAPQAGEAEKGANKNLLLVDDAAQTSQQNAHLFSAPNNDDPSSEFVRQALALLAEQSDDMLAALLDLLKKQLSFDGAALLAQQPQGELKALQVVSTSDSLSFSRQIATRVLQKGEALNIPDALGDTQFREGKSVIDNKLRSVLALPLKVHNKIVGVLFLSKSQRDFYRTEQQDLAWQTAPIFALATQLEQQRQAVKKQMLVAQSHSRGKAPVGELLGDSPQMQNLRELVDRVAPLPQSVLIRGETGSGKELVARRLYKKQRGANTGHKIPFVVVNCAALPENLVESELFGHERGAFSGADKRRLGKLELASGGTLFLDEIGELPLPVQAKLLRALEQKSFYRLGGLQPITVDFRLVSASHRDLKQMTSAGRFRQDLYYRLNVVSLDIAPLRERRADIELLARHFLRNFYQETGQPPQDFAEEVLPILRAYAWPGNVRELRNVVERMAVLSQGPDIGLDLVPADLLWPTSATRMTTENAPQKNNGSAQKTHNFDQAQQAQASSAGHFNLADRVQQLERQCIIAALRQCRGRKIDAAKSLGISRPTLDKKIALYAIDIFAPDEVNEGSA